jgi:hypothetical protein
MLSKGWKILMMPKRLAVIISLKTSEEGALATEWLRTYQRGRFRIRLFLDQKKNFGWGWGRRNLRKVTYYTTIRGS